MKPVQIFECGLKYVAMLALFAAQPVARVALALPFFRSGLTRWNGFPNLTPATTYLFEEEFKLHIFGGEYSIPMPDIVAFLTACGEIALPILLIVGFATRLSALGLLAMTAVIQLVIPDGWINFHLYWAALALSVIAMGPGPLSIDRILSTILQRNPEGA